MSLKVLVVDDSPVTRELLKEMLAFLEHEVVAEAENVKDAIKAYDSLRPELVMLDLSLADGDGFSVLKGIRRLHSEAKIIVLSGNPQKNVREQALSLGARAFLTKPMNLDEFRDTLAKIFPA